MQEMNPIDEVLEQLQDIYQEELPEYMDKKLKLIEGVGTFPRHLPEFDLKGFLDDLRVLDRNNKLRGLFRKCRRIEALMALWDDLPKVKYEGGVLFNLPDTSKN